jgi:hypothetical protein
MGMTDLNNDYATGESDVELPDYIEPMKLWFGDEDYAEFEFEIEVYHGGDYLVTIFCGEISGRAADGSEGEAPRPIHALYGEEGSLLAIEQAQRFAQEIVDDPEILNRDDLEDALSSYIEGYNEVIALGSGDWIRGTIRLQNQALKAVIDAAEIVRRVFPKLSTAYEPGDPKATSFDELAERADDAR